MVAETPRVTYDKYIKILQEIQKFEIIQSESRILEQKEHLVREQLNVIREKLVELRKEVPASILSKFDQLMSKSGSGVIDLLHEKQCGACRVSLVLDNLKRMEINKISPNCHSCGKFIDVWQN